MRRSMVLLSMALLFVGGGKSSGQPSHTCDEATARTIGRLYYLTNPINEQTNPQSIEAFVRSNAQLLSRGSNLINCIRHVGNRLVMHGLLSFSQQDANDAYGSAIGMGATMEQAGKVRDSVNQGSIETMAMGQELLWLAEVIPDAAAGNWISYGTRGTELRLQIRQVWRMLQPMMEMDPSMRTIVEQTMGQFQPWIEYQVVFMVLLMSN